MTETTKKILVASCVSNKCDSSAAFEQVVSYIFSRRYSAIQGSNITVVASDFESNHCTSPANIEQVRQYLDVSIKTNTDSYEYNSPSASNRLFFDVVDATQLVIGNWNSFLVTSDCVTTQIEYSDGTIVKGESFAAGYDSGDLAVNVQSIQLASGSVTLYRDVDIYPRRTDFAWTCVPAASRIQYTTQIVMIGKFVTATIVIAQDPDTVAVTGLTITSETIRCALSVVNSSFATLSFPNWVTQTFPKTGVGEGLTITGNTSLTTLSAPLLNSLQTSVTISGNDVLTSIDFPSLYSLYGNLVIIGNPLVTTISLPVLANVPTSEFFIYNNDSVTTIDLRALPGTWWGFFIHDNAALTSVNLSAFTRTNLSNTTILPDIQFGVYDNASLTTITIDDSFYPVGMSEIDVTGNALSATTANRLVYYSNVALGYGGYLAPDGLDNFQLLMDGGTNSPPTGIYNTLVFVMRSYGATISTN